MPLDITMTDKEGGVTLFALTGSIDATTAPALEAKVDAALRKKPKAVVFDMAGVTYISSAGIRVILKTRKVLSQGGGQVMMVHVQPSVQKVFDIIHALPAQQLFSSVEELDSYLDKIQKGV